MQGLKERKQKMLRGVATVGILLGCTAVVASAAAITGVTNISGSVNVGNTGTLASPQLYLDFFSGPLPCATPSLGAAGCGSVNASSTGDFPTPGPGLVTILDLLSPPLNVSGAENLPSWLVFTGGSNVHMDLTFLAPGGGVDCSTLTLAQLQAANTSCTAFFGGAASPFTLTNDQSATNVAVRLSANLLGWTTSSATGTTPYTGQFTTQVSGNLFSVLSAANTAAGFAPNGVSFSANIAPIPGVPEPLSFALMGGGLILLGFVRRRKANR
jgi:hypothetical protein